MTKNKQIARLPDLPTQDKKELSSIMADTITLTESERRVMELRFGIGNLSAHSLSDVGGMLKPRISRERVRQLQNSALVKIRSVINGRKNSK